MALTDKLTALGDAIRSKTGKTEKLTLDQMATEIADIQTGGGELPERAFLITGDCTGRFKGGIWDWCINSFGDKAVTEDITNCYQMFYRSTVSSIPFEINCSKTAEVSLQDMFYDSGIEIPPKITYVNAGTMSSMFENCYKLRLIPDDWCENFNWERQQANQSQHSYGSGRIFRNCYRLKKFPLDLYRYNSPATSGWYFDNGFYYCHSLDELVDLPIPYTMPVTSNKFTITFNGCSKLKNMTFEMPNGQPLIKEWKSQTIDLSKYVGATGGVSNVQQNAGWSSEDEVKNDATYQALKNTEDWWTKSYDYSKYNHDSAVATINSLPDTSAYLAENGGTNTIKFKGTAGSKTDGGAINTLTEAEIAVATAKGWTVTLV